MQHFNHRKYQRAPRVQNSDRQWPDRVISKAPVWASVDLRDGNQALLEPMTVEQKRRMWALLVKMGFKQIEVGFPSASQREYDFLRWLIEARQIPDDVTVQVLVQAREDLIVRTFEALEGVHAAIVHVYNSTSPTQREKVFGQSREGIIDIARQGAGWLQREAKQYPDTRWTFQYSPESFTSTEPDFAVEICDAVIDIWQPTPEAPAIINLPATVEVATPNVFADQVEVFCREVSRRDSIIVSVHTHNDRGGAVAAAELALLAGADRVEGTLLGNGERTGNMDIVTLAMNLYSQGIDPGLDLSTPDEMISIYRECTGLPVHPRHPWVGELVYTAFSGSHQDAIRKCLAQQSRREPWDVAYLPIDPADLGRDYQEVIRVNSQSGKGGIAFVLERDHGLNLPRWLQVELAQQVQQESERRKGEIGSDEIAQIFHEMFVRDAEPVRLLGYQLRRSGGDEIVVRIAEDGDEKVLQGTGAGAMAAFIDAWSRWSGQQLSIVDYSEHALGEGTEADAVAYVLLNVDGVRVAGAGLSSDTVLASLRAVLSGLNRARLAVGAVA